MRESRKASKKLRKTPTAENGCAMQDEMDSLHENHTYELVELPKGKRALRNKWVYKLKPGDGGNPPRYKARISIRNEHVNCVMTEEIPLRTKASSAWLERKDHAAAASDGLCDVKIGLFLVHSERST